jgi:hypothetical protein
VCVCVSPLSLVWYIAKSGTTPDNIAALAKEVGQLEGICLAGLMTIGRPNAGADQPDFVVGFSVYVSQSSSPAGYWI